MEQTCIKGALMMIVDTVAEIHVVCARHRKMLDDNISLDEGAIAMDTSGCRREEGMAGGVSIRAM